MIHRATQLDKWFETALGQRLLQAERGAIEKILPQLFGYHLVQIGGMGKGKLLESSRIVHRCVLSQFTASFHPYSQVCATVDSLPFAQDSVDVVVLPHILEFAEHPHEVLREVERILIPSGHIIILGFNPISLWGVRRLLSKREVAPWCGRFLTMSRLKDWLALVGFDLTAQETFFFAPPFQNQYTTPTIPFLEYLGTHLMWYFGAVYLIAAKKQVVTLTPIKLRWRAQQPLISSVIVKD